MDTQSQVLLVLTVLPYLTINFVIHISEGELVAWAFLSCICSFTTSIYTYEVLNIDKYLSKFLPNIGLGEFLDTKYHTV